VKRIIFLLAVFLITGIAFGQTLKKGAVVIVNTYEMTLKPDVTMNQFLDFYMNTYIPEFEKNYPGLKVFITYGDRGAHKYEIGEIMYCESVEIRDKYWPTEDGEVSEAARTAEAKMAQVNQESSKYVLDGKRTYTDWVIK
jgi:hypothetical protein